MFTLQSSSCFFKQCCEPACDIPTIPALGMVYVQAMMGDKSVDAAICKELAPVLSDVAQIPSLIAVKELIIYNGNGCIANSLLFIQSRMFSF